MTLRLLGQIELPGHRSSGGFDHADIHSPTDRIYVAHTANDSIDVIDCAQDRYVESIPGFTSVAGALVSKARGLVFTTNRGGNTVSVFTPGGERNVFKIRVGIKPNGVAFDSARGLLIVANVGDPAISDSFTASVVDVGRKERIAEIKERPNLLDLNQCIMMKESVHACSPFFIIQLPIFPGSGQIRAIRRHAHQFLRAGQTIRPTRGG
jgi:YVTN family beta-propeller protein